MKKILVTGASSFLGKSLMPKLAQYSDQFVILRPSSGILDLLDPVSVNDYITLNKPDTILHLAAVCGGIGANKKSPADFLHKNLKMTSNLFDAISNTNGYNKVSRGPAPIQRFYGLGSVCMYPKFAPVPFKEESLWDGMPEETNFPYGESKRVMLLMQQSYRKQFLLGGAHLIPVNMYGPHDHFDLENSHVIPALIRKFVEATRDKKPTVPVWGDGTATREFLYVDDCADAIVNTVVQELDFTEPVNIGTGVDISIKELAKKIKNLTGYTGKVVFSGDKAINGQPQRRLDVSFAKQIIGFTATTKLDVGLEKTIKWFKDCSL